MDYQQLYTNFALKDLPSQGVRSGTIDFFYNRYGDWQLFEFTANPFLEFEKISCSTYKRNLDDKDVCELIKSYLEEKKYVYIPVDQYEVSVYNRYQQSHMVHNLFVCGYDDEEKVFYVWDNLHTGKYQSAKVSYDEMSRGFKSLYEHEEYYYWCETGEIIAFRFYQKPWHEDKKELYAINIESIKVAINEYLLTPGYGESYRHISYYSYGIDCYNELEKLLLSGIDNPTEYLDHRAFSSMKDHKSVMLFRLEYLQKYLNTDLSQYIEVYKELQNNMTLIIHKLIKSHIVNKTTLLEQSVALLQHTKRKVMLEHL